MWGLLKGGTNKHSYKAEATDVENKHGLPVDKCGGREILGDWNKHRHTAAAKSRPSCLSPCNLTDAHQAPAPGVLQARILLYIKQIVNKNLL